MANDNGLVNVEVRQDGVRIGSHSVRGIISVPSPFAISVAPLVGRDDMEPVSQVKTN